jgi:PAS domain S-box-containing protein
LEFARKVRVGLAVEIITAQLALVRTLRGLTRTFGSFDDEQFNERRIERRFAENPDLAMPERMYWVRKLQARYFAGEYADAIEASERAQRLRVLSGQRLFRTGDYQFYSALSHAASWDSAPVGERQQHLDAVASHHAQLQVGAENCPENFENRAALVGAEIARIEGRELDAERLYEQAIRSARANGFVHHEALAHELAARFYAARGFEKIARTYLREARDGYLRWGADGKVRQLDQLSPHLRTEEPSPDARGTIGAPIEHLELATVLKVSQAISGEIELERLIQTLLRTAIEHAGAERGLLLLLRGTELRIQAEANTTGTAVTICLREAAVSAADLPESLVHYAARTQESVILDDASASTPFSTDEYLRQKHARSVLCLPLVKQGRLVALLYLENNLAPAIFTPARIAVLKVLATESAMALENGRLYRDLQEREAKIRRLVDANIVGVLIANLDGQILEANDAFLAMVGYTRDDLTAGRLRWTELTPPEWEVATQRAVAQMRATGSCDLFEKEYFRKDGSHVPVLVAGAAIEGPGSHENVVFVLDLTERKRAEEARQTAVLEERTRMAREIHDTLAQAFTGILLQLGAAERVLAEVPEQGQAHLRTIGDLAREGLAEARRSVQALRPQALEQGDLAGALARMVEQLNTQPDTQITFRLGGSARPLPPAVADHLLRMGQEAITNALRHAQASQIGVELTFGDAELTLRVTDDGRGFAGDIAPRPGHFGLTGMQERAGLIGAQLTVESQPGCGTRVELAWRFPRAD